VVEEGEVDAVKRRSKVAVAGHDAVVDGLGAW
jgi:hypothetical protein